MTDVAFFGEQLAAAAEHDTDEASEAKKTSCSPKYKKKVKH